MKTRIKEVIVSVLPTIVCHILAFELVSAILFGLGWYGINSLRSALNNGILFGTIFGIVYGLKDRRWYQGAVWEAAIIGGLMLLNIVIGMLAMPGYTFGMGARNLLDMLLSAFLAGALSVLSVKTMKWHCRQMIYPTHRGSP